MNNMNKNIQSKIKVISITTITILLLCLILKYFFPAEWSFITPHKQGDFVRVGNSYSYANNTKTVLLNDGRVLITNENIELYNPSTRKFKKIKLHNKINSFPEVVKLKNGNVLLIGGKNDKEETSCKTLIFYPDTNMIHIGPDMLISRVNHSAILLNDGRVFIVGGINISNKKTYLKSTEYYNPKTNKFEKGPDLPEPLYSPALVNNNGKIYIFGGLRETSSSLRLICNNDVYILSNTIKLVGNISKPGFAIQAYKISADKILLYDGYNPIDGNITIELYDTKANSSKILQHNLKIYNDVIPVLLPDKTLLFIGGSSGIGISYKEHREAHIFDYRINELKLLRSKPVFTRCNAKAIVLQDKNLLIFGGKLVRLLGLINIYPTEIYKYK